MKRRKFIKLFGGAAATWSLAARAQQPKIAKIGVLVAGTPDPAPFWTIFRQAMQDRGYVEGQNVQYDYRSAEGDRTRLKQLAAALVHDNVE